MNRRPISWVTGLRELSDSPRLPWASSLTQRPYCSTGERFSPSCSSSVAMSSRVARRLLRIDERVDVVAWHHMDEEEGDERHAEEDRDGDDQPSEDVTSHMRGSNWVRSLDERE